ncbi:MAG: polyprenyl synthetase family protein [Pseudomonadota bacterium]
MTAETDARLAPLPAPGDGPGTERWLAAVGATVAGATQEAVARLARSPDQARLFALGLADMRLAQPGGDRLLTSAHVLAALMLDRGAGPRLLGPVGALATLFETGIDIIDNVADRELAPHWAAAPDGAATLVGTLFVSGLPMALLAALPIPETRRIRLLATIGRFSTAIAHGQQEDYALSGAEIVPLDRIEASYRQKTGDRHAMLVRLALEAAGETEDAPLQAAETFGRALGLALQIRSDIGHLFGEEALRDVRNGTRTWPVAFALQAAEGAARSELLRLLDPGAGSAEALVDWLTARGVLVAATLRAERAAAEARALLSALVRTEAATALLDRATRRGGVAAAAGAASG